MGYPCRKTDLIDDFDLIEQLRREADRQPRVPGRSKNRAIAGFNRRRGPQIAMLLYSVNYFHPKVLSRSRAARRG